MIRSSVALLVSVRWSSTVEYGNSSSIAEEVEGRGLSLSEVSEAKNSDTEGVGVR